MKAALFFLAYQDFAYEDINFFEIHIKKAAKF
ncbi:hypothetical protein BSG1_05220 [Bacillus sp. SG-1]|nr:hypothetical protein BSG1_05220 [Bacillus sp. SG-1]